MDIRCISWPLVVDVINPTNMMWDDSMKGMRWVIEHYDRPYSSLKTFRTLQRQYPEWALEKENKGITSFIMYWDEEWVAYLVDRELVYGPVKHGDGHLPFTPILPVMNFTYADGPPEERYRGLLRPIRNLLDEEARLMTQIGAQVRTISYRTLDFHGSRQMAEDGAAY